MIFLDYASNYPVKKEVLDEFVRVESTYFGNANSLHTLGKRSHDFLMDIDRKMHDVLHLSDEYEIIHTSSATESNNMVIKGLYESHGGYSSCFFSSEFEHSSVNSTLAYLKDKGCEIALIKTKPDGKIDTEDLKSKLEKAPLLTCLSKVESEAGAIQDEKEVLSLLHKKEDSYLLLDVTQAMGKFPIDFENQDFVSFAPHKFGGIIGSGVLIKKKSIPLIPLLHGGKSLSLYRSSTPTIGLIASTYVALKLALEAREENYHIVKERQNQILQGIKEFKDIQINSNLENPYILNLSFGNENAQKIVSYLSEKGICVSQKSACSILNTPSKVINSIYHDKKRALSSFRISLSDKVTKEDIAALITCLGEYENGRYRR